jgi:predicted  nucleic acid-binding Zn-ribbon protein
VDELRKQLCHEGDVAIKRMNRHRQEIDSLRDASFRLEERVKMLEDEKAILEAKVDSMSEKLCRCSESSPRIKGQGSAAAPFELEDEEELEYATPPTSRPESSSTSVPGKWQLLSS